MSYKWKSHWQPLNIALNVKLCTTTPHTDIPLPGQYSAGGIWQTSIILTLKQTWWTQLTPSNYLNWTVFPTKYNHSMQYTWQSLTTPRTQTSARFGHEKGPQHPIHHHLKNQQTSGNNQQLPSNNKYSTPSQRNKDPLDKGPTSELSVINSMQQHSKPLPLKNNHKFPSRNKKLTCLALQ